ncbi:MAG: 50S ribosomal protein L25 [Candidatus Bostrichicola ureolyticus]|nr:MAG: 50S ribosomal protein L25 [Candidatus Bostrichicola ureolyticus]
MTIKGIIRKQLGKKNSNYLRQLEKVPCILYNKSINIPFFISYTDIQNLIYPPIIHKINLELFNTKEELNAHLKFETIIRNIQYHPVSDKIIHADFFILDKDQKISLEVPIKIIGRSPGVSKGGKFHFILKKLNIKAKPYYIPKYIELDINSLELGDRICINDLPKSNYNILHPINTIIAMVKTSKIT